MDNLKHGAAVILVRKDGAVLIAHRENKPNIAYPDYWSYPSGAVLAGEDFERAAIRELTEETGYVPDKVFPLLEEDFLRWDGSTGRRHIFWTLYDDKQPIVCNEGLEMKFMFPEELADKKVPPGQLEIIKKAIAATQKAKM